MQQIGAADGDDSGAFGYLICEVESVDILVDMLPDHEIKFSEPVLQVPRDVIRTLPS